MTLASAHPDPDTISYWETQSNTLVKNHVHGVARLMNTIAYQGSISMAEREQKYSRTPNESDIVPIKGEKRHSWETKEVRSELYGQCQHCLPRPEL